MAFREMHAKETKVLQMVKLPPRVFQDATVTTVILTFQREKAEPDHNIALKYYSDGKFEDFNHALAYKRILESSNYAFGFNQDIPIRVKNEKLGSLVKFSLGIKTSNDKYFVGDAKKNDEYYPLLRGKDIVA